MKEPKANAYSEGNRRMWSKLTPAQRKKRMAPLIQARWKGVSKEERSAHARRAALARWGSAKKKTRKNANSKSVSS